MVHKLAIVAVIGLTASAACIGAAAAIGGKDFGSGLEDFSLFDSRPRCEAVPGANAAVRDLDWDGSDHVGLAVLAPATYAPGGSDKLHAAGDPQVLAHLRIRDGNIEMDCRGWRDRTQRRHHHAAGTRIPQVRARWRRRPDAQQSQSGGCFDRYRRRGQGQGQ